MEDRLLLATLTVTNANDDNSAGSLRHELGVAAAGDTIKFAIPGSGVHTINVGSTLAVGVGVTIDGTSQAGYAGSPLIVLNGSGAAAGSDGFDLSASNTTIKGLAIDQFSGNGIKITAGTGDVIRANYIGVGPTGKIAAGNGGDGILVAGGGAETIGGAAAGQGNVISGNGNFGVELNGTPTVISGDLVVGNLIGTDASGATKLGNTAGGIVLDNATATTVGGTAAGAGNVISGNGGPGISTLADTAGSLIEGNAIGTDRGGTLSLGNNGDGIRLFSSNNTIGGLAAGQANTIAFNGNATSGAGAGIGLILNVVSDEILSNAIYSNVGLGIDLGGSGNKNLAAPSLSAASTSATSTTVVGSIAGGAGASEIVQFFANDVTGPSGFGQGQTLIGTQTYTIGGGGTAAFTAVLPVAVKPGQFISATVTDPNQNTSGFSQDVSTLGTADLSVKVQADHASAVAGDQVTYTITVTNNGPTLARSVQLTEDLPANVTVVSDSSTPGTIAPGSGTLVDTIGNLASGGTAVMTVVVQTSAASAPSLVDSATVTSIDGDPDPNNNTDSLTIPLSQVADLAVVVTGDSNSVPVGQNVTYTVTLTNDGPSGATGVVLKDTLPANVTFVSAKDSLGTSLTPSAGVLTDTLGSLANGASVTLTIVVTTTALNPPSITDSAKVTANEVNQTPAKASASATTTVTPAANLLVTVAGTPDPVQVGQSLTYTVTLKNNGPSAATGISLVDALPANVTYVSATDTAGGTISQSKGKVTDAIATLAANATVKLTIVVKPTTTTAASVTDTATVTAADDADPTSPNDTATTTTTVDQVADLAVTLTPSASTIAAGQPLTYQVKVTNNGPSAATGVTLVDTLPATVGFVSATDSLGASLSPDTGSPTTLTDALGSLAAGASATLTIVVTPSAASVPSITDTVTASSDVVNNTPAQATQSVTTTVTPSADLTVGITPPTAPILLDSNVTYRVVATNLGPSPATGVVLTDTLPAGVTLVSATDSLGNTLSPSGGVLTDALGTLASGASVTLSITVTTTAVGTITDQASVSSPVADPDPSNNTTSVGSAVVPVADLAVSAMADQAQATTGVLLTYTFTVTNQGPSPATGITLTDPIPPGAFFVSATATGGLPVSQISGGVQAAVGTLAPGASATLAVVVVPTLTGDLSDSASASANEVDPNPANNTGTVDLNVVEPPGTLQFSAPTVTVNDTDGVATITVTRTDGSQGTVAVAYQTSGGSAVAGVDYGSVAGVLTFGPGVTSQTFTVPIVDNPNNKFDRTVQVNLFAPGGGAVIGAQATATVTIHEVDPDVIPPVVTDLRLAGTTNAIYYVTLFVSKGLDPTSASNPNHYLLIDTATGARVPLIVGYFPATDSVAVVPTAPLSPNVFYYLQASGVTDLAGNGLDGTGLYASYLARGTSLTYADSHGSVVSLAVTGGGVLDLTRFPDGDGDRLQLLDPVPGRTTLTGRVAGPATNFASITGLGAFGQVRVDMTTPPFYVDALPFSLTDTSAPAVDVAIPVPTPATPTPTRRTPPIRPIGRVRPIPRPVIRRPVRF